MASSFPISNYLSKTQELTSLCTVPQPTIERFPDERFEDIRRHIQDEIRDEQWTRRPRTYFILWQLRRLDAMPAFILQGLDDTSLPYQGRKDLPNALNPEEANLFLRWQEVVYSEVLEVEKNKHITIKNGDKLFDSCCPKLGIGSQG